MAEAHVTRKEVNDSLRGCCGNALCRDVFPARSASSKSKACSPHLLVMTLVLWICDGYCDGCHSCCVL